METKSILCVFFIVLLVSPTPILTETLEDMNETRNKRQAQVLLPLASYAGMTVAAPVFAALVTAYGIYAVTTYAIKKGIYYFLLSKSHVVHLDFKTMFCYSPMQTIMY